MLGNFRLPPIRSKKVLRSAKDQPCTARFPGICNGNPETTIWAHLNGAEFGKGMATKAHDVLGFHSCSDCHAYYDVGHGTKPLLSDAALRVCLLSAVCETYVRLIQMGIVVIPIDAPKSASAKPTPARKPKAARAPIAQRADPWPEVRKIPTKSFPKREENA